MKFEGQYNLIVASSPAPFKIKINSVPEGHVKFKFNAATASPPLLPISHVKHRRLKKNVYQGTLLINEENIIWGVRGLIEEATRVQVARQRRPRRLDSQRTACADSSLRRQVHPVFPRVWSRENGCSSSGFHADKH